MSIYHVSINKDIGKKKKERYHSSLCYMTMKICWELPWQRNDALGFYSHKMCSNFATIEGTKVGTSFLKRFLRKEILLVPRNTKAGKKRNDCSDVNKTSIILNFHLYIVQL